METNLPASRKPNSPPIVDDGPDGERNEALTAYRTGTITFMGITLHVARGVLVPRPETELLGQAVLRFIDVIGTRKPAGDFVNIIDVCCGSGNLACGLAAARPSVEVWATDLTDPCVELARQNVEELNLQDRVRIFQGDLFSSLSEQGLEQKADVIVCNPPYIPSKMLANRTDLRHEPQTAFDGGPYGLSILMRVLIEAPRYLRTGGGLFLEIGPREEQHAIGLLLRSKKYEKIEAIRNSEGIVWGVSGRTISSSSP